MPNEHKLGPDGEPVPVGNEAQRKAAAAVWGGATHVKKDEIHNNPHVVDTNSPVVVNTVNVNPQTQASGKMIPPSGHVGV